jgi:hypothetical protein
VDFDVARVRVSLEQFLDGEVLVGLNHADRTPDVFRVVKAEIQEEAAEFGNGRSRSGGDSRVLPRGG